MVNNQDGPFEDLEAVLASIGHTLLAKGCIEDAAIFAKATIDLEYHEHDNWNGGTSIWNLNVRVPLPSFTSYSDDEKKKLEDFINQTLQPFLPEIGHWVNAKIRPLPFKDPNWRNNIAEAIKGTDVNNQGRAHSQNIAKLKFEGLLFRSEPEILLYKALKATGIPLAPLPVFVRGGTTFSRVEPDFVLIKDGAVVFVEIDGSAFHKESPADAHYRVKPFQDEGVIIERIKAEHCNTQEKANQFAKQLADLIRKRNAQK